MQCEGRGWSGRTLRWEMRVSSIRTLSSLLCLSLSLSLSLSRSYSILLVAIPKYLRLGLYKEQIYLAHSFGG
jgi:hypothetical protein